MGAPSNSLSQAHGIPPVIEPALHYSWRTATIGRFVWRRTERSSWPDIYLYRPRIGAPMREAQRRLAMTAWRKLFVLAENEVSAEDKYFRLLSRADDMERAELITSEEWRKLVQQAGTSLARTAKCMGGAG